MPQTRRVALFAAVGTLFVAGWVVLGWTFLYATCFGSTMECTSTTGPTVGRLVAGAALVLSTGPIAYRLGGRDRRFLALPLAFPFAFLGLTVLLFFLMATF